MANANSTPTNLEKENGKKWIFSKVYSTKCVFHLIDETTYSEHGIFGIYLPRG